MKLLDAIAPGRNDRVYFVGDLIDRGPKSSHVVRFVRDSGHGCVLGNHEQMLLESVTQGRVQQHAVQSWLHSGGQATISSYTSSTALTNDVEWMRTLPAYLDLGDIWLVHAGMHPGLAVEAQTIQECCWIREEFHSATRPYFPNKLIISGHTITFTLPNVIPGALAKGYGWLDIDTGAYHPRSGWLSGVDMASKQVYQFNVVHNVLRILPLAEAMVQIDPTQVVARRRQLQLQPHS